MADPVDQETLILLLKAAMSAPTACNSQPWEFIVVTQTEVLDKIRSKMLFARYNASAAIVVCGNLKIANNSAVRDHWVQDCSAATENILIAAAGMGLAAVSIGVYPYPSKIKPLSEAHGIPENVIPLSMVYVGRLRRSKRRALNTMNTESIGSITNRANAGQRSRTQNTYPERKER